MLNADEKKKSFDEVRIITYIVVIISGIISWIAPFRYICASDEYTCLFCGMRHAIVYLLQFDFKNAYSSNPLVILVIIAGIWMVFDSTMIIRRRLNGKKKISKTAE